MIMKKILLALTIFTLISISASAATKEGINFFSGSWEQAKEQASKENKLIFVDFYTQWCGPCYNMAKNVFVLHSVGVFYNQHFINLKIDAENGEGVDLAKRYKIVSYPTYVFIDPKTEQVVHRSSSRQSAETFIFTGKSALDPKTSSSYLVKQKVEGSTDGEFLINYANYAGSCYKKDELSLAIKQLSSLQDYSLSNPMIWALFKTYALGRDNKYFEDFIANIPKYKQLYGDKEVEDKLFAECQILTNDNELENIPNFAGKDFLILKYKADKARSKKDYVLAAKYADELMAGYKEYEKEKCEFFVFFARSNQYGECPEAWHNKCLEISRYVAYNSPDRDEMLIHYEYAKQLELKLKRANVALSEPSFGVKEYSLRPLDLKQKPKRK